MVEISNDTDRLVATPADKLNLGRKCIQWKLACTKVSPGWKFSSVVKTVSILDNDGDLMIFPARLPGNR